MELNTCKVGSYSTLHTERTTVKNNLTCCNHHEISQIPGETYCICVNFTVQCMNFLWDDINDKIKG